MTKGKDHKSHYRVAIVLAVLSLLSAFIFNEINLKHLQKDHVPLRENETIITADDYTYISPAQNLLTTGEFKENFPGNGAFLIRSPGYSSIYAFFGLFLDFKNTLFAVKILQLVLFALAIYCMYFIALYFLLNQTWALIVTGFYGISGIGFGFIYYTLTEGITPALIIIFTFILLQAKKTQSIKRKQWIYYFSAVLFSFIFITRPFLGVFGVLFPFFIISDFVKQPKRCILNLILVGFISIGGMLFWQIRNYNITHEIVSLNPIYYPENSHSSFRPTHQALWNLSKGWGEIGANFHDYMGTFWSGAMRGVTAQENTREIIDRLPKHIVKELGRERFREMFLNYHQSILHQKKYIDQNRAMPKDIPELEKSTITQIKALTADFKNKFWIQYYITSPLKVFKEMAFHSNLSLYVFQKSFRGHPLMEFLRLLSFIVHALAFLALPFSVFMRKPHYLKAIFSYVLIIYVGYLIFIQRGIEERYTLPILALSLIYLAYFIKTRYSLISKKPNTTPNK